MIDNNKMDSIFAGRKYGSEVLKEFKKYFEGKKIIIYGGGILGVGMHKIFLYSRIEVLCVIDKNPEVCRGRFSIPIYSPSYLMELKNIEEYEIVLAVNEQIAEEVRAEYRDFKNINFLFISEKYQNILKKSICMEKLQKQDFAPLDCFECGVVDNACEVFYEYGKSMVEGEVTPLCALEGIGIIMGSICSLRCKHCNEALPYFENTHRCFEKKEDILGSLRRLIEACGVIGHVELVGGEPFLHPDLKEVLEEILELNIGIIQIFTNGTVIPSDELCGILQNKRIVIYISNYEKALNPIQKKNLKDLKKKFDNYHIIYMAGRSKSWMDFTSFEDVVESEESLRNRYENCGMSKCHRLYRGHLYGCPHHYGGTMLGYISKDLALDIYKYSINELRDMLQQFREIPCEACRKCKMPFDAPFVEDAIQLGGEINGRKVDYTK